MLLLLLLFFNPSQSFKEFSQLPKCLELHISIEEKSVFLSILSNRKDEASGVSLHVTASVCLKKN